MCLTLVIDHHWADLKDPPLTQVMFQRGNSSNTVSLFLAIWDLCHMFIQFTSRPKSFWGAWRCWRVAPATLHVITLLHIPVLNIYPRLESYLKDSPMLLCSPGIQLGKGAKFFRFGRLHIYMTSICSISMMSLQHPSFQAWCQKNLPTVRL